MNYFSKQLSLLLSRQGITKYKLAKLSGLSPAYITLLSNGNRFPSDEALKKIAAVVGTDFAVMQSWVNVDKLGATGLENLKQHVLDNSAQAGTLPPADTFIQPVISLLQHINHAAVPSQHFIREALKNIQHLLQAAGVALWQLDPKHNIARIIEYNGLPSEYVVIANLKLAEQGMVEGEAFPIISVLKNRQPLQITGLLENKTHPLYFYANILKMTSIYILPVPLASTTLAIALYLKQESEALLEQAKLWLSLYIELIVTAFKVNSAHIIR